MTISVEIKIPALEKLIDYSASGIGAVAGTVLSTWKANKLAQAKLVETNSAADSMRIISQAQAEAHSILKKIDTSASSSVRMHSEGFEYRVMFQESKRQHNIAYVIMRAAQELQDEQVPDHEPDHDWTARFFSSAQDISSVDMQENWARILAGEVRAPNSTSLRTLNILKDMSSKDAKEFSDLEACTIHSIVQHSCFRVATIEAGNVPNVEYMNSVPSSFIRLSELGLFRNLENTNPSFYLDRMGRYLAIKGEDVILIKGRPNQQIVVPTGYALSLSGRELAKVCDNRFNMDYLRYFSHFLSENKCSIGIGNVKAISRDDDGIHYNVRDFEDVR